MNIGSKKSKTLYLSQGDHNTSYYHAHASIRWSRNQIKEFVTIDNNKIMFPIEISYSISKEFHTHFISNPACHFDSRIDFESISPIITFEDNEFLLSDVSGEEIKRATFDLAPDKSPGLDGFPPYFFQKYWTLVGNYVIRAVKAFCSPHS